MKYLLSVLLFVVAMDVFALGGRGPLELNKDGLKNKASVILDKIGIDEKLGDKINLDLPFVDSFGTNITLRKYFQNKPVFMILAYYKCPTLCNTHLNQVIKTLTDFEWTVGDKFNFVVVSIDPNETPKDAEEKRKALLNAYGRQEFKQNWHFLTGSESSIKEISNQIGFKFAWEPVQEQWAHAAASYVLSPEGKLSYYHYGIDVDLKVFKLSLIEAAENKIGNIVDRMVLFCLQYDPDKKTYAFYAYNLMKVAAFLMALFLGLFLYNFWRKENKTQL